MDNIKQKLIKIYENGKDYSKFNDGTRRKDENNIVENEKIVETLLNNNLSIITGSNGIGKTHMLKEIGKELDNRKLTYTMINLKEYNSFDSFKNDFEEEKNIVLLDGLDELNINIVNNVKDYIFNCKEKIIILSSRKDCLQKYNLIGQNYNIYELSTIPIYKIKEVLKDSNIDIPELEKLMHILSLPRFLEYVINDVKSIKDNEIINKYKIMEIVLDSHFKKINERASIKIEDAIHKKILQSMALSMMMAGKSSLTKEEFVIFFSSIKNLDIKNYILNKELIDSFLNNHILLDNEKTIQFENKEIMEFLAAKEIIENKISNSDLFEMVSNGENEINPFWFNTLSYVVLADETYRRLILDYIYNNILNEDNLINLVFYIEFTTNDKKYIIKLFPKLLYEYTKLYQYIYDNEDVLKRIIRTAKKDIIKYLIEEISKIDFSKDIDKFNIIFINNIQTLLIDIIEESKDNMEDFEQLKVFMKDKKQLIVKNVAINVRFYIIFIMIMEAEDIDVLIQENITNNRLLSLLLYHCKKLNELKNFENIVNSYIVRYKNRLHDSEILISDSSITKYINDNYNAKKMVKLVELLNTDEEKASLFYFFNKNRIMEESKFKRKSIAQALYDKIIKEFLSNEEIIENQLRDEIIIERHNNNLFEKIIELCVYYKIIDVEILSNEYENNYIKDYFCEKLIKALIKSGEGIENIYSKLYKKDLLFITWRLYLDNKEDTEATIKELFPELYKSYVDYIYKSNNQKYYRIEESLNEISTSNNIYYKISNIIPIIENEEKLDIITKDTILNNVFKSIIKEIQEYVRNVDVYKVKIEYNKEKGLYTYGHDAIYYGKAIQVLYNSNIDIKEYNDKNIILYKNYILNKVIIFDNNNREKLLEYLNNHASEGYIKLYINEIIERLVDERYTELCGLIFEWLEKFDFGETDLDQMIDVLCRNKDNIEEEKIKKLTKYNEYLSCQDLLIMANVKSEIVKRIEYIENNLVKEGNPFDNDDYDPYRYSTNVYIKALAKMSIDNIGYITSLVIFAFKKYNEGNYYYFTEYIIKLAETYIKNNINHKEVNKLIDKIVSLEKENNDRRLYKICNSIKELKNKNDVDYYMVVSNLNYIYSKNIQKIFTYDELFNEIEKILNNTIFEDIKRIKLFEIFRIKNNKIQKLNEQTFQFFIGYELKRLLNFEGYKVKIDFESTGFDKKRNDIQIASEGFIQNIVIETKLLTNPDIGSASNTNNYINTILKGYSQKFNSPKILFVIINQNSSEETCKKRMKYIADTNSEFVFPILIDLKDIFDEEKNSNRY